MTRPGKIPTLRAGIEPRIFHSRDGRLTHSANEAVCGCGKCWKWQSLLKRGSREWSETPPPSRPSSTPPPPHTHLMTSQTRLNSSFACKSRRWLPFFQLASDHCHANIPTNALIFQPCRQLAADKNGGHLTAHLSHTSQDRCPRLQTKGCFVSAGCR